MAEDLQLSSLMEGLIAAAALIGIFFGAPIGGWVTDRLGRKKLFMITLAVYMLATLATAIRLCPPARNCSTVLRSISPLGAISTVPSAN